MINFLNEGDKFMNYQKPKTFIENLEIEREEAIKRLRLMGEINEETAYIPFKHTQEEMN